MVASEKRLGSRRVMTVLGKIPVAPKPINLPSQRSENEGDVSRGTSLLGSPEGRTPSDATKSRKLNAREEENTSKDSESLLSIVGKDLGGKDVAGSGSLGSGTSLPSPILNTSQVLDNYAKKGDLQNYDSSTSAGISKPGAEKASDSLPTKNGDTDSGGGVNGSFSRPAVPPPGFERAGHGPGNATSQNGMHSFQPSVSYRSGTKQREVIVVHMVGNGGFYGNYPVQIGYSASPPFGNFPLQFGNFEPYFGLPGPPMLDGGSWTSPAPSREFFHDHEEGFVCYEKECSRGGHDRARHRNGRVLGAIPDGAQRDVHGASLSATVSALASRPSFQKHVFKNPGRTRSAYSTGSVISTEISPAKPVPERGFTLLKKACQRKMLVDNLNEEVGGVQGPLTEGSDGSDSPASVRMKVHEQNRGECLSPVTPLETSEAIEVIKGPDTQKSKCGVSEIPHESSLPQENVTVMNLATPVSANPSDGDASLSTTSCNVKCLQCNAEATASRESTGKVTSNITVAGITPSTLDCHFPPKDETSTSIEKSTCVDGCKVEVKHVIFDADSCQINALLNEANASSNVMAEAGAKNESGKKIHKSIKKEASSEQRKSQFSGVVSLSDRKGKHKRLHGVAQVDHKVSTPAWKPKVLPATKASKGIQKSAKQMNKSLGDVHDCQRRQSGSVVIGLGSVALKEIFEAGDVMQGKSLDMAQELYIPWESGVAGNGKASACNAKCSHCKAETAGCKGCKGQVHGKTIVHEITSSTMPECCSTTMEEKSLAPTERTTFTDRCKVEVKHVIFDADSCHVKDSGSVEAITVIGEATSLKTQNGTDPESFTRKSTQQKTRTWKLNLAMKKEHKRFSTSWKPKLGAARQAKLATKTSNLTQMSKIQVKERHSFSKTSEAVCVDPERRLEGEGPQEKAQEHRNSQETGVKRDVHVAVSDGAASALAYVDRSQEQVSDNMRCLRAAAPFSDGSITVPPTCHYKPVDAEGVAASFLSAHVSENTCVEGVGACRSLIAPSETSKAGKVEEEVADSRENVFMSASDSLEQAMSLSLALENGMAAPVCTEAYEECIIPATWVDGCKVEAKHVICDGNTTVSAASELTSKKEGTGNPKIKASGWRPGFTKPFRHRTPGQENFHQKVFRKYKETGKWAPKPALRVRGVPNIVDSKHGSSQAKRIPDIMEHSHGTGQGQPKAASGVLLADITESRHESGKWEPKAGDVLRGDIMESRHGNGQGKSEDACEDMVTDTQKDCHQARQEKPEVTHGAPVADLMESRPEGAHEAPVPGTMESTHETKQGKPEGAHEAPSADFMGNNHGGQGDSEASGMCNPDGRQPGFTKPFHPRTPGQERFHQKVFRKYKQTGKWTPKANNQAAVRPDNLEKQ